MAGAVQWSLLSIVCCDGVIVRFPSTVPEPGTVSSDLLGEGIGREYTDRGEDGTWPGKLYERKTSGFNWKHTTREVVFSSHDVLPAGYPAWLVVGVHVVITNDDT